MRLLLDTHALLWFIGGSRELSDRAREVIEDPGNDVTVSVVSYWEIVIKVHKGRLQLPLPPPEWLAQNVDPYAFRLIPVERRDVEGLHRLGQPGEHADPFDRLLVATAQHRSLTLVTRDAHLSAYGVSLMW